MLGAVSVVQEDVGQTATGSTESSRSNSFFLAGCFQLSQEAAVSVLRRSTVSEGLSTMLGNDNERSPLSVRADEGAEAILVVIAERLHGCLRLKDYKRSKKSLERKLSDRGVILEAMKTSVKLPENNLSSVQNERSLLEKSGERMMRNQS